jgi:hypothetical protein
MQNHSRQELYRAFIEFIRNDSQRERSAVNRRMLGVALWCFVLPTLVALSVLLLVKWNVLPPRARGFLDWLVLVFPVTYSVYFLSSEVLREVPAAFRRGGIANTLGQSLKEGEWRERVCEGMRRSLHASGDDWTWLTASFRMDLDSLQYRNRYLTALGGAVFFLIMQGIDSITDTDKTTWIRDSVLGWVEAASYSDLSQYVGLALFLVLLYLSGSQNYHSLQRYMHCAELLALEREQAAQKE